MPLRIGIDLVHIPRIQALMSDRTALERLFLPSELKIKDPAHLAGILAAKEAVFKALNISPRWHEVMISSTPSGKPKAALSDGLSKKTGANVLDLSISHDGDHAVAVALVEVNTSKTKG